MPLKYNRDCEVHGHLMPDGHCTCANQEAAVDLVVVGMMLMKQQFVIDKLVTLKQATSALDRLVGNLDRRKTP